MKMNELGRSGIMISDLCLGTMTYGTQTDRADAFAQMDMSVEAGINLFDTAEMYPVNPITAETQGDSERLVGDWFQASVSAIKWCWPPNILAWGSNISVTERRSPPVQSQRRLMAA